MAFSVVSCKVVGAPVEIASRTISGDHTVQYTVEVTKDGTEYVGPRSVLAACQAISPPTATLQPVPRRWATYDYTWLLGSDSTEKDLGSFCKDWIIQPTSQRRTHWTIIAMFSRLQPGEMPNVDRDGNEILDPINWWPRYYLRKFVVGEALDSGWPRDPIAGEGRAAVQPDTKVYGPFKLNGIVQDDNNHPLDTDSGGGFNERYFQGIDHPQSPDSRPITRANLISPTTFPVIKREYGLLVVRMNFPTLDSFWQRDQQQLYTVWNGGDDWKANVELNPAVTTPDGRLFFNCRWGSARYDGGSIIGEPQYDNGFGYYIGEFRYLLYFDREAVVRVRNDSTIDVDGLPIETAAGAVDAAGNVIVATEPQWLGLDGKWLGASVSNAEDRIANWIRWWYGGGFDYSQVGNGGTTSNGAGGTENIRVGMFESGDDYVFPNEFPYPGNLVPFPP